MFPGKVRHVGAVCVGLLALLGLTVTASGQAARPATPGGASGTAGSGAATGAPAAGTGTAPAATGSAAKPQAPARPARPDLGPPLLGWAVQPDVLAQKPRYQASLRLTLPVKGFPQYVVPNRPAATIVGISDKSGFEEGWYVLNLLTGQALPIQRCAVKLDDPELSPDGALIAGKAGREAGKPPAVKVWSFKQNKLLHTFPSPDDTWAQEILGFADNDLLMLVEKDGHEHKLVLMSIKTGTKVREIAGFPSGVRDENAALSANGKYLAVYTSDRLHVYDLQQGQLAGDVHPSGDKDKRLDGWFKAMAFSPDGEEIALLFETSGKFRLVSIDANTGRPVFNRVVEDTKETFFNRFRGKPLLEVLPDNNGYRLGRAIVDGESGKCVYSLKDLGVEEDVPVLRMLDGTTIVACSPHQSGRVTALTARLPKAEIDKALATVRSGGKSVDANLPPLTKTSEDGAKAVVLAAPDEWALKPDTAPDPKRVPTKAVPLKDKQASGPDRASAQVKRVVFSGPPANQAFITYEARDSNRMDAEPTKTTIERVGLGAGGMASTFDVPPGSVLLDVAPDGKRALLQLGDRLDLYDLLAMAAIKPLKPVAGWRPFEGEEQPFGGRHASRAGYVLPGDRVLSIANGGKVVVWSVPDCKAVWTLKLDSYPQSRPALSPNRKHLAVATRGGVYLLDALTGDTLARCPSSADNVGPLAFHPDGSKLAIVGRNVLVWDLANAGTKLHEFALPMPRPMNIGGELRWCGADHLMAADTYLIDLKRMMCTWRYTSGAGMRSEVVGQADDRWWTVTDLAGGNLVGLALPHPELVEQLKTVDATTVLAVKPGAKVSLECNVGGDEAFKKSVLARMAARAREVGLVVTDNQPLKLVASTEQKSRTETYGRGPFGRQDQETVTIPMVECHLTITYEGEKVWETTSVEGGYHPGFVRLRDGESVQQKVDESNKNIGQQFFRSLPPLPRNVARPQPQIGFGASRVTATGLVPYNPGSGRQGG